MDRLKPALLSPLLWTRPLSLDLAALFAHSTAYKGGGQLWSLTLHSQCILSFSSEIAPFGCTHILTYPLPFTWYIWSCPELNHCSQQLTKLFTLLWCTKGSYPCRQVHCNELWVTGLSVILEISYTYLILIAFSCRQAVDDGSGTGCWLQKIV